MSQIQHQPQIVSLPDGSQAQLINGQVVPIQQTQNYAPITQYHQHVQQAPSMRQEKLNALTGGYSIDEITEVAKLVVASKMYCEKTSSYNQKNKKDPNTELAETVMKLMFGAKYGWTAPECMNNVVVINGKTTLDSTAMRTILDNHPDYRYEVTVSTAEKCTITVCKWDFRLRDYLKVGDSTFTMDDAERAGLASSSTYKKYPVAMLLHRCTSQAIRALCPGIFGGKVYTADEIGADIEIIDGNNVYSFTTPEDDKVNPSKRQQKPKAKKESSHQLPFKDIEGAIEWAMKITHLSRTCVENILEATEQTKNGKAFTFVENIDKVIHHLYRVHGVLPKLDYEVILVMFENCVKPSIDEWIEYFTEKSNSYLSEQQDTFEGELMKAQSDSIVPPSEEVLEF